MKCKLLIFTAFVLLSGIMASAEVYLVKPNYTGGTINYKGYDLGQSQVFTSLSSLSGMSIPSGSIVFVDGGTYSDNITITSPGITIYGNNSYCLTRNGNRTQTKSPNMHNRRLTVLEGTAFESPQFHTPRHT